MFSPEQLVSAACIVDADVEIDFAPSSESEGAEERARAAAEAQHTAQIEAQNQAAARAAEEADPWSHVHKGAGRVLGTGAAADDTLMNEASTLGDQSSGMPGSSSDAMSEREKRLAALQRRGL